MLCYVVLCCTLLLKIQDSFTTHGASCIQCDFKCYRAPALVTLSCCPITTQLLCYHIPSTLYNKCRTLRIAHTYVYIYIYNRICVYTHTHTHIYIYIYMHIYTHTNYDFKEPSF